MESRIDLAIRRIAAAVLLAIAPAAAPGAAQAQDQPQEKAVSLELNNARDVDGGCRLTYIAVNGTGTALDKASYEIVVFDADSRVAQFLILEFGKLPSGKTKVVEFDFPSRNCTAITRILINDVSECVAGGAPSTLCMDGLKPSTRTPIGFGL
jgi:hypothetical protein